MSTFASIPKLPSELMDVVLIDYLHDDMPVLRTCSTVSRSWLPAARSHLFTSRCVIDHEWGGEFRDLNAFLQSPRACFGGVRRLQLTGYTSEIDISTLTSILDIMCNLRCLELVGISISSAQASWHSFKLDQLVLNDLVVPSVDCFLEIFNIFSDIRELEIQDAGPYDWLDRLQGLVPLPHDLKVECLSLRTSHPLLFQTCHRMLSMESLKSIDAGRNSPKAMEAFGALLRDAGPNVHNLRFVVYEFGERDTRALWEQWSILNMSPCKSLRTLHIGVWEAFISEFKVYELFESALEVIDQTSHTLESLTLEFSSLRCFEGEKEPMISLLNELDWDSFDAHCGGERDMLQSVTIIFNHLEDFDCDEIDPFLMDDVVTYFHSKLPLLSEKGVLKFDSDIE